MITGVSAWGGWTSRGVQRASATATRARQQSCARWPAPSPDQPSGGDSRAHAALRRVPTARPRARCASAPPLRARTCSEQRAAAYLRQQRVADLAGRARDEHALRGGHPCARPAVEGDLRRVAGGGGGRGGAGGRPPPRTGARPVPRAECGAASFDAAALRFDRSHNTNMYFTVEFLHKHMSGQRSTEIQIQMRFCRQSATSGSAAAGSSSSRRARSGQERTGRHSRRRRPRGARQRAALAVAAGLVPCAPPWAGEAGGPRVGY